MNLSTGFTESVQITAPRGIHCDSKNACFVWAQTQQKLMKITDTINGPQVEGAIFCFSFLFFYFGTLFAEFIHSL